MSGTIRLFIQTGDLLFVRQNTDWLSCLMRLGIGYSVWRNFLFLGSALLFILPLWLVYDNASLSTISLFIAFVFVFRLNVQFVRQLLSVHLQRWKLHAMNAAFFIVFLTLFTLFYYSDPFAQLSLIGLHILALIFLYRKRMNMRWCFYEDCNREEQQRLKLTSMLISASGYQMGKRGKVRKKPFLLFPQSTQLFRTRTNANLVSESFIKYVLRSRTSLTSILRIIGIYNFAIILVPNWIKWVVLFVGLYNLIHYIESSWKELKNHSFSRLYPFASHEETTKGVKKRPNDASSSRLLRFWVYSRLYRICFTTARMLSSYLNVLTRFYYDEKELD